MSEPKKTLVLHIEIPDVFADDLDEYAGYLSEPDAPGAEDRLHIVTEEWFRDQVVVSFVTLPGDKCLNHEFEIIGREGRIVGAELRDRPVPPVETGDTKDE